MVTPCLIWGRRLFFAALIAGIVFILISFKPFSKEQKSNQMENDKWNASKRKTHYVTPLEMANLTKICTKADQMEMLTITPKYSTQQKSLKAFSKATKAHNFQENATEIHKNIHINSSNGTLACNKNLSVFNVTSMQPQTQNVPLKKVKVPEIIMLNHTNSTLSHQNLTTNEPNVPGSTHNFTLKKESPAKIKKEVVSSNSTLLVKTESPANVSNTISLKNLKAQFPNSNSKSSAKHIVSKPSHRNLTTNEKNLNESKIMNIKSLKLQPQNVTFREDQIFKDISQVDKDQKIPESSVEQHQNLTQRIENVFKNISSLSSSPKDRNQSLSSSDITNSPAQNVTPTMDKPLSSFQGNMSLNKTQQNASLSGEKVPEFKNITADMKFQNVFQNVSSANLRYNTTNLEASNTAHILIEDILLSSSKPTPGKTIFFAETSHFLDLTYNIHEMRARHACAIEAAALHNPNFRVFLLFACRTYLEEPVPIIDALLSYKNIKFRELNIETYILDTPITDWLKLDDLYRSRFDQII